MYYLFFLIFYLMHLLSSNFSWVFVLLVLSGFILHLLQKFAMFHLYFLSSAPSPLPLYFSSPEGQSSCEWQTLQWCGPEASVRCIYRRGPHRLWAVGKAMRRSWGAAVCCCVTCCCRECGGVRAPPAGWRTAAGRFAASPAGQPASLGPGPWRQMGEMWGFRSVWRGHGYSGWCP